MLRRPLFYIGTFLSFVIIRIQALLKTKKILFPPPNTIISVTSRCNKSCSFCHYLPELNGSSSVDLELKIEGLIKILDSDAVSRFGRVCLYGGEPLLNKDFFDMVKELKSRNYFVTTVTNGLLIERYLKELEEFPLDLMTVSYYPEDVEKIKESIKKITKLMPVNISFVLDQNSQNKLEDVLIYARDVGADMVTIESLREVDFCERKSLNEELLMEKKSRLIKEFGKDFILRWSSFNGEKEKSKISCIDFWDSVFVNSKGELSPCCQYPLSSYEGSLNSKAESINSKVMMDLREKFSKNIVPKGCENCHYLYGCDPLYKSN